MPFLTPPSVPHPFQFNTSVPQKGPLLFSPKNPSVPHQKLLSSTQPSISHQRGLGVELRGFWFGTEREWNRGVFCVEPRGRWNWGVFCVELRDFGVELRGFWCRTEGFLVLKRCGPLWNRCVELRGSVWNWGVLICQKRFELFRWPFYDSGYHRGLSVAFQIKLEKAKCEVS